MPGRKRTVPNWDDPKALAKLRELVESGLDDAEIGRALGYGSKQAFTTALRRQEAVAAIEILYASRTDALVKLLKKLWLHAENDESRQQMAAVKALLERFERMAAGEPQPGSFTERIALCDEQKPPTSDDLLAALRPAKAEMQ